MTYRVAKGQCFGNKDRQWLAGDEISRDVFSPREAFDEFVKRRMIVADGGKAVEENAEEQKPAPQNSAAAVKTGKK